MSRLARLADQLRRQRFDPQARTDTSYQESRARRESAAAEMAQIALRQRASELIDIDAARECLAAANAVIREELGNLPAELTKAIMPLLGDEGAIRLEMDRCIAAALNRLCDRLEQE